MSRFLTIFMLLVLVVNVVAVQLGQMVITRFTRMPIHNRLIPQLLCLNATLPLVSHTVPCI